MVILKPSKELFVQSYLEHNAHGQKAYLATHPGVKEVSARVNASRLLADINIRRRISEELEKRGLGLTTIIKLLKSILRKKTFKNGSSVSYYRPSAEIKLEVVDRLLRLHGLDHSIQLTVEELEKREQIIKEGKVQAIGEAGS